MALKLSKERIALALEDRFPGKKVKLVRQLQAEWAKVIGAQPSASSYYRWISGALPKSSEHLWKLARVLDVDPTGLLEVEKIHENEINSLIRMFQIDMWGHNSAVSYLKDFLGRQAVWPNAEYLQKYFSGRRWFTADFVHDAAVNKNFYQMVALASCDVAERQTVRTFHIAFRQESLFAGRWLQYGIIIRTPDKVVLLHINGDLQSYRPGGPMEPSRFETFFGPESVTFRVACLHDFTLEVLSSQAPALEAVRFR